MTYFCPRCYSPDLEYLGEDYFNENVKSYACNACSQIFSCFDDGKQLNEAYKGTGR